ncbi:MAG TPA: hypothetical protein VF070_49445 [Streptosporangiaceae bacterium]
MDRPGHQGGNYLSQGAFRRGRPIWVWAVPFAALFALLCVRNRFLFTQKLYEQGDAGANSILIAQAKRFTLLVGNYSREGFHHPGPAYMYVQAAGEWLLRDVLHAAPTAWNAHMLAVFALNCAFVAMAVTVVYGWTRSPAAAAACFAVVVAFIVWYPWIANSDWMPSMYALPYVAFVIAAASVAAGAARDVWIVALSGWLLIHGHACFLLFVPVITVAAVAIVMWRFGWRACLTRFRDRLWVPATVISAVFLLPIVVNLVLHWPGDFGTYVSYGKSGRAGGHGPRQILDYLIWFWWPHAYAWSVPIIGYAAAIAVTVWLASGALRRFLLALLVVNLVSTVVLIAYAAVGIDYLTDYYIAYFYWSAPLVTALVIAVGVISWLTVRIAVALAGAGAIAAYSVLALLPGALASTNDIDPALPSAVATVATQHPGKTIVLRIQHPAWVPVSGFLVQAERTGVPVCVDDPWYQFLFSSQFICTPAQAASGVPYWFYDPAPPPGAHVLLRFSGVAVVKA